jgi:rfaE bifunctional protein nucleotidyltransferase chain/domain
MDTSYKIVDLAAWEDYRRWFRSQEWVVTNGCFDILHAGHVAYLEKARSLGKYLAVGLNGDASVRALKGEGRPINTEQDRARVLAALECVDRVVIFPDPRATAFLEISRPHVYVKGGDYSVESLHPPEREAVEAAGGKIVILPLVEGHSTTETIKRIAR